MGNFAGHTLPGVFFIIFSFWWLLNILKILVWGGYNTKPSARLASSTSRSDEDPTEYFESSTWFPRIRVTNRGFLRKLPLEPLIKVIATTIGMIGELNKGNWSLFNQHGDFDNLNNFAHTTMFAFFMFSALIEVQRFFKVLPLPKAIDHVALSLAFTVEGLLFYFHIDGRPILDQKLHKLLYGVIFTVAVVLLLEGWQRTSVVLLVVRAFLTMLQGTWFIQIAHSLYGRKPWKDTHRNREFVPIAFAWHVMGLLLVWWFCFLCASVCTCVCRHRRQKVNTAACSTEDGEQDHILNTAAELHSLIAHENGE